MHLDSKKVGFLTSALAVCIVILLGFSMFYGFFGLQVASVRADEVQELQKQIDELENLKKLSVAATTPLEKEVQTLEGRIQSARASIARARSEATNLATEIAAREIDLVTQYEILGERIRNQYKRARQLSPLLALASTADASALTKDLAYRSSVREQDNRLITSIGSEIYSLELAKQKLERDQVTLAHLEKQLDTQAEFFKGEIAKAKSYQLELLGKIAEVSAKQKAILAARTGSFLTSVGEVPLADDFNASIGFKSQAPANSFAVFSFGAYTHRNGMSQYGARARAEDGQSVEDILKAYFPNATLKKDYSVMSTITVDGVGSIPFEDQYMHGIYEMPISWHTNALKAQAITARTFAIRRTNNGQKSICATELCQVFKNSRKGGEWEKAVNETRGWVLVDGSGNPVSTQYASTHGGYSRTSGWDTTDASGGGDWATKAWENKARSPWFYKSWYRSGYSSSGANCGRNHPWLSQEEFSDIVNAWIVRTGSSGADTGRIVPVTINECNLGGGSGNPYSMAELREWAGKAGGAVTSVSSVSVSHSDSGQTTSVRLETNRGSITIPGKEFKETYNIRAPGYLRIPQNSFAFFNIEKN
jgi:peptidoglycan hydrolase-like amidase